MEDAGTGGHSSGETNLLRGDKLTTDSKFKGDEVHTQGLNADDQSVRGAVGVA